jgi:hypothetical protein
MGVRLTSILEGFRAALRREELPPPSPAVSRVDAGPGLLQVIFARETLPQDPPVAPPTTRGFLGVLFGREQLGQEAPPPAPPRSHWFTWLFRPEHLED